MAPAYNGCNTCLMGNGVQPGANEEQGRAATTPCKWEQEPSRRPAPLCQWPWPWHPGMAAPHPPDPHHPPPQQCVLCSLGQAELWLSSMGEAASVAFSPGPGEDTMAGNELRLGSSSSPRYSHHLRPRNQVMDRLVEGSGNHLPRGSLGVQRAVHLHAAPGSREQRS